MRTVILVLGVLSSAVAPATAQDLPSGACPAEGSAGLQAALERTDSGAGAAAELDLAACYRGLEQEVAEAAALGRALESGDLAAADDPLVRARLDAIGWPPPPHAEEGMAAAVEADRCDEDDDEDGEDGESTDDDDAAEAMAAYVLTGVAAAALASATAVGFIALDADADGDDALVPGVAAAAALLWPDEDEVRPTAGPGDVGVGVVITF
jgi:hypothetical protein